MHGPGTPKRPLRNAQDFALTIDTVHRPEQDARRSPGLRRRNLPLMLLQARERVLAQFRPILNAHGVTEQQWRIVRALLDTGPMEPRQLVMLCGVSSPSLAGILARMEELGWVERRRFANDHRRVRVSLTPASRALAARLAPAIEAMYAALENRVGQTVLRDLDRALDALMAHLSDDQDIAGGSPRAIGRHQAT